jgi:hypothetical protein
MQECTFPCSTTFPGTHPHLNTSYHTRFCRERPSLWLNASSESWEGITVNWPYPAADATWLEYWKRKLKQPATVLEDAGVCTILTQVPSAAAAVKGVDAWEPSDRIDALQWIAATAAGLLDAVPATTSMIAANPCLASLPVVLVLPLAETFSTDLDAYEWMLQNLLSNLNTPPPVLVGACRSWTNYSCGWSDPLGMVALDYAVARRGIVVNLAAADPLQSAMLRRIGSLLPAFGIVSGWMEPEDVMVDLLSQCGLVVQCGAPNLPFFYSWTPTPSSLRLPYHRTAVEFDRNKTYVAFQSNEGDTPKNAYSFRGGNWLNPKRGSVPIAWGVAPIVAEEFPGLWEYYVDTALVSDTFFAATGGVGYTHPWTFRNLTALAGKAGLLIERYMPTADNWVDVWESACPGDGGEHAGRANPCALLYQEYVDGSGGRIGGFSQQPTSATSGRYPDWVDRTWTLDGTPVLQQPLSLWYPVERGACNKSDIVPYVEAHLHEAAAGSRYVPMTSRHSPIFIISWPTMIISSSRRLRTASSISTRTRARRTHTHAHTRTNTRAHTHTHTHTLTRRTSHNSPSPPPTHTHTCSRFVLAYGVLNYVDVAADVQQRLGDAGIVVIGAQDLAALAWREGPRGSPQMLPTSEYSVAPRKYSGRPVLDPFKAFPMNRGGL